jgi:hypothetical protein
MFLMAVMVDARLLLLLLLLLLLVVCTLLSLRVGFPLLNC